jgi:hypothetical protein
MTALVLVSSGAGSAISLYGVLLMIPVLLLLAPQPIRRDKRVIVGAALAIAAALGVPVLAAICNVCEICKVCDWWWCPLECWLLG